MLLMFFATLAALVFLFRKVLAIVVTHFSHMNAFSLFHLFLRFSAFSDPPQATKRTRPNKPAIYTCQYIKLRNYSFFLSEGRYLLQY